MFSTMSESTRTVILGLKFQESIVSTYKEAMKWRFRTVGIIPIEGCKSPRKDQVTKLAPSFGTSWIFFLGTRLTPILAFS